MQRIADFIIGDCLSVEACQQIAPSTVIVTIRLDVFPVLHNGSNIAVLVIVFGGDAISCGAGKLISAGRAEVCFAAPCLSLH